MPVNTMISASFASDVLTETSIPCLHTDRFIDGSNALEEDNFRKVWAQGRPIVVTGLLHKFHHAWSPEYFIENYGHQACKLVECRSEREKDCLVADFFRQLGRPRALDGDIWKLKDWPPSSNFNTEFPALSRDFERALPMSSYTRRDGVMNIAAHFPKEALAPDLGSPIITLLVLEAYFE